MAKSIAIIELYQHDEVLRHYCELLQDSGCNIKVFCSKVVHERLNDFRGVDGFDWTVQSDRESKAQFLEKHYTVLETQDLVFITTALNDFKVFYELSKRNKTVLLIHNAHSFLAPDQFLFFEKPLLDRLRYLKLYIQGANFYKRKLLNSLTGLAFPTDQILDYVKDTFEVPKGMELLSLPFAYAKERKPLSNDRFTITIPGTVMASLRDYNAVYQAFLMLKGRLTKKVRLVFLGRSGKAGQTLLKPFYTLVNENLEVLSFEAFISPEEYESHLLKTDFLLLPFKKEGRNHIYKERLGYSKISGSINDMIRYGLPALIPDHYPLDESLQLISERYSAEELADKLEYWINESVFMINNTKRKMLLERYRKEKLQEDFLEKITSLLNAQ